MSLHINRFVERLQGFEARGQRDFTMSLKEAKDLHADITRLLSDLVELKTATKQQPVDEVITVNMDGGNF
jgi:hypothetical protein